MLLPKDLKYTQEHEWVKIQGDRVTVGITDYAQKELGDIVYVEIETIGKLLDAEAVFGTVEAVKTVSDLFLPIAGTVTEEEFPSPKFHAQVPMGGPKIWVASVKVTVSPMQAVSSHIVKPATGLL